MFLSNMPDQNNPWLLNLPPGRIFQHHKGQPPRLPYPSTLTLPGWVIIAGQCPDLTQPTQDSQLISS